MIESVTDHAMVMLEPDGTIVPWKPGRRKALRLRTRRPSDRNISSPRQELHREEDELADLHFAIEHGPAEGEGWRMRKDEVGSGATW